jgi:hypothetical protein
MRVLSGIKLVLSCVKKIMDENLYVSSSELTRGITLLACSGRGLMKRKNYFRESWFEYAPGPVDCGGGW